MCGMYQAGENSKIDCGIDYFPIFRWSAFISFLVSSAL